MRARLRSGTFWFSVAVVVVLSVGAGLSVVFWGDLAGTGDDRESLSTTVRNVMLMIGGLLALPLAIWRGWVAERQVKATQASVDAAQIAISSQRFQSAAEMLGSSYHPVAIGAIRTLDRMAHESPDIYYRDAMTLLSEYVRKPPSQRIPRNSDSGRTFFYPSPDTEILVPQGAALALAVIGRRNVKWDVLLDRPLSLAEAKLEDLRGLKLTNVVLSNARLRRCDAEGTDFSGADLSECVFSGANLHTAMFSGANLTGTRFTSHYIDSDGLYGDQGELATDVIVKGLTQRQLDEGWAEEGNPPRVRGVVDPETGKALRWRGELT